MLSLYDQQSALNQSGINRREWMRLGGLSMLGLSSASLSQLRSQAADGAHTPPSKNKINSCVFVFLFGGPSHIDLWDMKPDAPAEVRGEFQPIETNVPGIQLCEHLPYLAQQMDKFSLIRSTTHKMPVHGPACSEIYSGRPYFGPPVTDQATPEDWPSLSAMVSRFGKAHTGLPPSVVLPWYTQFVGQDKRIAGQTGGRMGENWNPFLIKGDPNQKGFEVQGVRLPKEVSEARFDQRKQLLKNIGGMASNRLGLSLDTELMAGNYESAMKLIDASQSIDAFSVEKEPAELRAKYGPTKFGQSLLLARRVVESGVSLVTVNWDDETRFDKVSPHWDTHHHNFPKLKDGLCPIFDRAFAGFLEDLDDRGLLDTTLVVVLGEFGRTPKIGVVTQNGMTEKTGRDHWPHAFTTLMAGGGIGGGQVYGSTNNTGGYVANDPVTPADLTATILYHLGIDAKTNYYDEFQNVERVLCHGSPVLGLS